MKSFKISLVLISVIFLSSVSYGQEDKEVLDLRKKIQDVFEVIRNKLSPNKVDEDIKPVPDNPKYKCDTCKDKKYITNGDGHKTNCPKCNLSGDIPKKNVIVMYSIKPCINCRVWNNTQRKIFSDNGWIIEDRDESLKTQKTFKSYPSFEVYTLGNKYTITNGTLDQKLMKEILDGKHNK